MACRFPLDLRMIILRWFFSLKLPTYLLLETCFSYIFFLLLFNSVFELSIDKFGVLSQSRACQIGSSVALDCILLSNKGFY